MFLIIVFLSKLIYKLETITVTIFCMAHYYVSLVHLSS